MLSLWKLKMYVTWYSSVSTGMSDAAIMELNLPTGIPIVYELDKDLKPIKPMQFLGDEETVRKAMEAVAAQGKVKKWRADINPETEIPPNLKETRAHYWIQVCLKTTKWIKLNTWHGHDPPPQTFSHFITVCNPPCVGLPHSDTANKSEHHFVYLLFRLSHSSPSSSLSALIQGFQQNGALLCKLTQRAHQRGCRVHFGSRPTLWCSGSSSSHSSLREPAAQTAHNGYGILPAP